MGPRPHADPRRRAGLLGGPRLSQPRRPLERGAVLERLTPRRDPLRWQLGTVKAVREETPRAKTFVFTLPSWPGHLAGQHVDIRLTAEDGYQAERSYSIASPPEERDVSLTVERLDDGEVSGYLTDVVEPGDVLELRGPIGGYFTWQAADGGPLLLVAGGSGLVPLAAMLRHRAAQHSSVDTRLLVSAGSLEDVLYRDELEGSRAEGVALHYTLTRHAPAGWSGWTRRVDAAMLREVGPDPEAAPRVYVCGPTAFVEAVADALVAAGHEPRRIKTERFGPTGG
ncbi:MAG TPA: ferredoxin reductase [Acidimicrobiia bacterium]|nr:ferredoxin reductase [Acidimicrobiia bacterium]